jgi:threonine dehydrogenase-like Zn-dependent dehydrogenase
MKALFIERPGATAIREIEKPVPQDDEVLIRVSKVGFCGGDMNAFRGLFELQEYPVVLGHELGGVVEESGKDVPAEFKPGTKVTVYPYKNCGTCLSCRRGRPNACFDNRTMGVRRPGAMTRYITVPYRDLFAAQNLSMEELALVEPLTVGFHAVDRARVSADDKVAVIGCGIVGMGAVAASVSRGAEVIAVDIDDRKMEIARNTGVKHTINTMKQDLHEALETATGEVAFTGRVVCIGYAKQPVEFDTGAFVKKEIEILGSRNCLGNFPEVIEYLESGAFPVQDVISRTVTLAEAGEALADWAANPGPITKILVDLDND